MATPTHHDFGDGNYPFLLRIKELRELQKVTSAGPMQLFQRMLSGGWQVDDSRETVRLGLIGGGMPPLDALGKVRMYVDDRPLAESVPLAMTILSVALFGSAEEESPPKEVPPQEGATTTSSSVN